MMLRSLPLSWKGHNTPVLVRVDWNIALSGEIESESHLKLQRSKELLLLLQQLGAKPILLTHLGRPEKREKRFSTERLVPLISKAVGLKVVFLNGSVQNKKDVQKMQKAINESKPGTIFLLDNVRFEKGEESNAVSLAKSYAMLASTFINDAFGVSHRKQATVVALAKACKQAYAGPALLQEVKQLSPLLKGKKSHTTVIIGGKKLSTKLPLIKAFDKRADLFLVGGAMVTPFLVAKGLSIGQSYVEKDMVKAIKPLLKRENLLLPIDVAVTEEVTKHPKLRYVDSNAIQKNDIIVDIGPKTIAYWHAIIQESKTIIWNGPVGISEIPTCAFGSISIAKSISRNEHVHAITGGGDTIPVLAQSKTLASFDFVSTGGGAMLEFFVNAGELPGLKALR